MKQKKGYFIIGVVCALYWVLDSVWSYLSFEYNLKKLIFSEPTSYLDTFLLKVPPYQLVSRLMVVFLFVVFGVLVMEYIKKRRASEKKLSTSEKKLRLIYQNASEGIMVADDNGSISDCNNQCVAMLGYRKSALLGMKTWDLIHPDDLSRIPSKFDEVVAGKILRIERKVVAHGGEALILDVSAKRVADNQIVLILRDVTERKKDQEKLKESESRLRYILDSLPDMIVEVDPRLNVMWANKTATVLNPEAVGQACYRAFPGNEEMCEGCYCQKAFETGRIEMGVMYQPESRTAGESYWENIGVPLKDRDGRVTSVLEVSRNVTEREMSRKRELKLQKELFQSQKMESIGNLAGGIAHDFNNILASIIGFTELSIDEVEAGTIVEDNLQEIYTAGKRARNLVRQILAFARQSEEARKPIQLGAVAEEVLHFMRSTIPATIEIKQHIDSESLVVANATQIHQVLMNLCTNAAQAMEAAGGTLQVSIADVAGDGISGMAPSNGHAKGCVEIRVSDTGVGIAPDAIDAIFEPYYTTKGPGEGTGMGLAVVQGIVETHGGQIRVDSMVGTGTTFTLVLPVAQKQGSRLHRYEKQELPTGAERILFVDDEAPLAKMGSQMLERLGYAVTTRTGSPEALELFRAKPDAFDLVVTDMTMPHLTGDRMAVEMMKIRPDIPVIICTGYSKKMSADAAAEIGIRAFAHKPIVKADLARTVRSVLDEAAGKMQGAV